MSNIEIIIGRSGAVVINDPYVSREHVKLIKEDNDIYLVDLNSTCGTFVNGQKIGKKRVKTTDKIILGKDYQLNISTILARLPKSDNEMVALFAQLEEVYKVYNQKRIEIQAYGQSQVLIKRSLPAVIPGAAVGVLGLTFGVPIAITAMVSLICGSIGGFIGIKWAAISVTKTPQKMQELDEQFKMDYVCPNCRRYLGLTPWQGLLNQGECPYCQRHFY